jgi:hypothetical protein
MGNRELGGRRALDRLMSVDHARGRCDVGNSIKDEMPRSSEFQTEFADQQAVEDDLMAATSQVSASWATKTSVPERPARMVLVIRMRN